MDWARLMSEVTNGLRDKPGRYLQLSLALSGSGSSRQTAFFQHAVGIGADVLHWRMQGFLARKPLLLSPPVRQFLPSVPLRLKAVRDFSPADHEGYSGLVLSLINI